MNSLFVLLGLESWKPVAAALLLPPVPLIALALVAAGVMRVRRAWGWLLLLMALAGLWLAQCSGFARAIESLLQTEPPPLGEARLAALRIDARRHAVVAILVLGGGAEPLAPEYGTSNLRPYSLERLRYGLWLARQTGLPVGFSGGVGWGSRPSAPEADIAARIAADEFHQPLRWIENQSRDTHENAAYATALLRRAGITHLVLVTHGWHMPRAMRQFEDAGRASGMTVEPAPMGLARQVDRPLLEWLPSELGAARTRQVLREVLARLFGA